MDDEYEYYGKYPFNCPICGHKHLYPASSMAGVQDTCNFCGTMMAIKPINGQLMLHATPLRPTNLFTDTNRINIAKIQVELGILYKISAKYQEAIDEVKKAIIRFDKYLESHPNDNTVLGNKSMALFNLGEIYQIQGRKSDALKIYKESLSIDKNIGDSTGMRVTKEALRILNA